MVEKKTKSPSKAKAAPAAKKSAGQKKAAGAKKQASAKPRAPKTKVDNSRVARASLRMVKISPRRARLVIDMVRGKQVEPALNALRFAPQKGAKLALKLLQSAIANAKEHKGLDVDRLWITRAWVDMGPAMMRYLPGAQGRANPIRKRFSHITLELSER